MNEILDFITSPEFGELCCRFLSGALFGGVVVLAICGVLSSRQRKRDPAAMCSRQPQYRPSAVNREHKTMTTPQIATSGSLPRMVRPFDVPDAEEHEQLLTEDTEDLDEYPDCGLPRHTRLRLIKGIILPTTVAMVEFIEYARPNYKSHEPVLHDDSANNRTH